MPHPIDINSVPMNYFLHGVDAAREAQNAQGPGGAVGQPADNGIAGEVQAPQPGPAAKMVQQLDVLLVCHGAVSRAIRSYFVSMTNDEFFDYLADNCELVAYDL